ncbi:16S rRNA (uracil1498-N3)-methyltransferase [Paenibacillus shirakamiensis]|uniref:Ribosomal RNA small subunit methyltransferase E n=1 Tax=Paenibacillus shirakamiensis TaxID=1265935 RepID=A0ABS4JDX4_9BACL|nr:RsmE family RNA methyltransferase [Paenibacillus shirakamiensis]MBP1999151.1 16S rRNA (uracil1498-N3)-methyltransferase [Paenibacillus shirakamiensis]
MQRYFIPTDQFGDSEVVITGEDARHIARVMRGKPKDQVIVSDGISREAVVELVLVDPLEVTAVIIETMDMSQEAWLQVTVAQSLPKGDKMELVIQKCTEIGATAFVPFLSERTIVQYDERKEDKRVTRWRKIAKEAAEQAHRSKVPDIEFSHSWKQLLQTFESYDLVLLCYEKEEGRQLRDVLQPFVENMDRSRTYRMLIAVGPEGGLTEKEVQQAETSGALSIGLGRRILRTETAAMAALTCMLYETGEMGGV